MKLKTLLLTLLFVLAGFANFSYASSIDITGNWKGTWASNNGVHGGSISGTLIQSSKNLSGALTLTNSPCVKSGIISGSVIGSTVDMSITSGKHSIRFTVDNVSLPGISGKYRAFGGLCEGDIGQLLIIKDSIASIPQQTVGRVNTNTKNNPVIVKDRSVDIINPETLFNKGDYKQAAEQGDAEAQYNLGYAYKDGKGVEQDDKQAVKWWTKSAEQGNVYAQNNLGYMYRNGKGVEQDDKQAVKWYTKSAEQGYANAQNSLGWMYQNGKGVEQDDKQAVKW